MSVHRILDANYNRAAEGFRTIEEAARFILNDESLTQLIKGLRHDLTRTIRQLPADQLLTARDTPGDVGTDLKTFDEKCRKGVADVVAAAAARVAQSLRALEEFGKTIDASFASNIESIRYRSYAATSEIQLAVIRWNPRRQLLAKARIYALIDAGSTQDGFVGRLEQLAAADVDVVQLRDRTVDDRTLYQRACIASSVSRKLGILMIINDRPDIALAADCDGVHVGQEELPVDAVRRIVGSERLIGWSTHDVMQVKQAIENGADYIGCGPCFPGQTKSFIDYPGMAFLTETVKALHGHDLPAFAIGGIGLSNIDQVAATGFNRIAVTAALNTTADLARTVRSLRQSLEQA